MREVKEPGLMPVRILAFLPLIRMILVLFLPYFANMITAITMAICLAVEYYRFENAGYRMDILTIITGIVLPPLYFYRRMNIVHQKTLKYSIYWCSIVILILAFMLVGMMQA